MRGSRGVALCRRCASGAGCIRGDDGRIESACVALQAADQRRLGRPPTAAASAEVAERRKPTQSHRFGSSTSPGVPDRRRLRSPAIVGAGSTTPRQVAPAASILSTAEAFGSAATMPERPKRCALDPLAGRRVGICDGTGQDALPQRLGSRRRPRSTPWASARSVTAIATGTGSSGSGSPSAERSAIQAQRRLARARKPMSSRAASSRPDARQPVSTAITPTRESRRRSDDRAAAERQRTPLAPEAT